MVTHVVRKSFGPRKPIEQACVTHNQPSSEPIATTKASSRLSYGGQKVVQGAWALTRPWLMMIMLSHKAETSCIMWLETKCTYQHPQLPKTGVDVAHHIFPLVGSSRIIVGS
jgi:hypothetical protein